MPSTTPPVIPPFVENFQRIESYVEIQEIMRSSDFVQGGSPERRVFFDDTLIMLDGEQHLQRKRIFGPLFSRDAMAFYESQLLDPLIEQVMGELRATRGSDGLARTDLVPLIRNMLHRISARLAGVDGVDTPARTERFRHLVAKLGEATAGQFSTRDKKDVVKEGLATLQALVEEFLQASLDRRRELVRQFNSGMLTQGVLPKDVLTFICLHGDDSRSRPDDTPPIRMSGANVPYSSRPQPRPLCIHCPTSLST
jgi:cytochrome P450